MQNTEIEYKVNQIVMVNLYNQKYIATIEKFSNYTTLDEKNIENKFIHLKNIFRINDGQKLWIGKPNEEKIFKNQILLILNEPI